MRPHTFAVGSVGEVDDIDAVEDGRESRQVGEVAPLMHREVVVSFGLDKEARG